MNLMPAPELPAGIEWFNTDHPLSIQELAGRIVLLYFGTFACSNCMRLMPDLRRLMEEHPEVVVIGVHAPGFESAPAAGNLREAISRAGIRYPVAIDHDRLLWQAFGVRSWPTFALIDPGGNILGKMAGEGFYSRLSPKIDRVRDDFEARGTLTRERFQPVADPSPALYFPGKIAADHAGMRLFISDTGHNRIIVTGRDGEIQQVIGTGAPGSADGPSREATFYLPEGLTFDESAGILYVADTGNHTIRRISWPDLVVETVAGTGLEAASPGGGGPGKSVALSKPRDLALMGDHLYIAMAGANQIWRMDLFTHTLEPYAGSGLEGLVDGPLRKAAFARPSGIVTDGEALYVADSGASAIRRIKRGMVETRIGHSPEDLGDLDTIARMARINHPAGIAIHQGLIYIADTGNHKVKEFDPDTGWVLTRIGSGERGYRNGVSGDARLNGPGGLVNLGGYWYIADTGNHAIRVYDPIEHVVLDLVLQQHAAIRHPLPEIPQ
ncbi:MAG: redoxin domain-containing protein [Methanomicrobiales archaeon]|nr:redoxin domain-containing protein [Methanomicrobiales archaeon]